MCGDEALELAALAVGPVIVRGICDILTLMDPATGDDVAELVAVTIVPGTAVLHPTNNGRGGDDERRVPTLEPLLTALSHDLSRKGGRVYLTSG